MSSYLCLLSNGLFKELTDQDVRKRLYEEQKNQIEQDMAPFGFMDDGLDDSSFVDAQGDNGLLMNMVIDHICGIICHNGLRWAV